MGDVLTLREGGEVGENAAALNETAENATMPPERLSHLFIYSVYAQTVSGLFVWAAIIITCMQVCMYITPVNMYFQSGYRDTGLL